MPIFDRVGSETISIKRAPAFDGGMRAEAALVSGLTDLTATKPMPVDAETRARIVPDGATLLYVLFIESDAGAYDIRNGDLVVWQNAECPIRECERWAINGRDTLRLVIEQRTDGFENDTIADVPRIYNVTLTNADTEYNQPLPGVCKRFTLRATTAFDVRFAYATGHVAASVAPFLTLKAGQTYAEDALDLNPTTIYLASATAGVVVQIVAWV